MDQDAPEDFARLKTLRGTPFDVFGYTAERRAERDLIAWYEEQIDALLGRIDAQRMPDILAIARAPMDIRGYGPVKDAAIAKVKAEVAGLSAQLAQAAPNEAASGSRRAPR